MNVSHPQNGGSRWLVSAWVSLLISGAAATGLLRAPLGGPAIASGALAAHAMLGAAIGSIAVWRLLRSRDTRAQLAAALVAAAVASGWWASRSFTPLSVAGHAIAAFAPLALLVEPARAVAWKTRAARAGLALLLFQIALAVFIRHHVVGLAWHLLVGGLAATVLLAPAVAVTHDEAASLREKRAARWAIAGFVVEALLGAALLLMIAGGSENVRLWMAARNAHVLGGTFALLTGAALSRVLAAG